MRKREREREREREMKHTFPDQRLQSNTHRTASLLTFSENWRLHVYNITHDPPPLFRPRTTSSTPAGRTPPRPGRKSWGAPSDAGRCFRFAQTGRFAGIVVMRRAALLKAEAVGRGERREKGTACRRPAARPAGGRAPALGPVPMPRTAARRRLGASPAAPGRPPGAPPQRSARRPGFGL